MPTLKDNDFIKQKIRICIGEDAKQKLFEILNADINVNNSIHYRNSIHSLFMTFENENDVEFFKCLNISVPNQTPSNGLLAFGWHTRYGTG